MTSEWKHEEEMTKEFALCALDEFKCFCRRLYFFPKKRAFQLKEQFECYAEIINGIKMLIENNVKE